MSGRLSRYLGLIFIAVVIVPAVVLSLLAVRSIGREEAYIQSQLASTLTAEVDHVATLVASQVTGIQTELAAAAGSPTALDPAADVEAWKARSPLVEIPFLLSADYEILWPRAGQVARAGETRGGGAEAPEVASAETQFIEKQQAFLTGEARVPVYENIAEAYKDDILGEPADAGQGSAPAVAKDLAGGEAGREDREAGEGFVDQVVGQADVGATRRPDVTEGETRVAVIGDAGESTADAISPTQQLHVRGGRAGETSYHLDSLALDQKGSVGTGSAGESEEQAGDETRKQTATSLFLQSAPVREKTYKAAEEQGQQIAYRNVEPEVSQNLDEAVAASERKRLTPAAESEGELLAAARGEKDASPQQPAERELAPAETKLREAVADKQAVSKTRTANEIARSAPAKEASRSPATPPPAVSGRAREEAERLRSIFIAQPLKLSEIVARGENGLVPLAVDGEMRLLYWQRLPAGKILGCLVEGRQVRERIIGALPGIFSPSRLLTVLNDKGAPLIVPQGEETRDWRRPFVAREISELLPRWEVAAYLADPGVISSRAHTASTLTWLLIFIMFVSIVAGGTLVVRSASAELKLAQQKTTFVANVSHELKTPLTSIRMFAEMLRDGRQPSEEKRRQYFDIMTAETERLTRLINNVLDFARMDQGKKRYTMKPCDLVALASGIMESQRARLEREGFVVSFTTRAARLTAMADEEAIKQTLVNLLSNAEKYSADTKEIEVAVGPEDGKAVISVADRGIGIAPGEAEKIFGEFYRVDDALTSRVKGTGLGLTIARRIARDHKGEIIYAAREGGGSIFKIALPLGASPVGEEAA